MAEKTEVNSVGQIEFESEKAASSTDQLAAYDEQEAKRILRKVDLRLLPCLTVLYLMSFMDRGNIGNARPLGMQRDLGLSGTQWNLCLTIFFFPYCAFEVPSNMILKLLPANLWMSILVFSWGTCMTLMSLVKNYQGLLAARFFLGFTDSGFFPAATYLLTCWYRRSELQGRLSLFFSAGSMAGAFSGLLAYGINNMAGIANLAGWRWILILEGLVTVVVGVACYFFLPNSPATARFLKPEERAFLLDRLAKDSGGTSAGGDMNEEPFKWKYVKNALTDYKIYLTVLIYFGNSLCTFGFIFTLPSVITELGYSAANAQLMTIPVYVFALLVTITASFLSDRYESRSNFIIYPSIIGTIGYIGLLALPHPGLPGATYGMLFVVAFGLYPVIVGILSWNANNLAGSWKRSIGVALQISIGGLGGAVGSNIFLSKEAPHYWTGYGVSLGGNILGLFAAVFLRWKLNKANKEREAMSLDEIHEKYTDEELREMGDRTPAISGDMEGRALSSSIKVPLSNCPSDTPWHRKADWEPNIDALHREQNVYCRLSPSVDTQLEGVVPYLALCPTATHLIHMENGDLRRYLENKDKNKNKPSLTLQLAWFRQMACALVPIHDQRVLICDSYRE
ncbi:hypothetical protein FQN51_003012 [Onygenales sp. PD_10]|nr:hypothetical protein FQN51_003012 [Onygenales sp. PD_10]